MVHLSPAREAWPKVFTDRRLIHRGKVRDTYDLSRKRLVVASDGVSIYDIVLNALIPEKGQVLTALTHFMFEHLGRLGYPTHLIAAGKDIDDFLPKRKCKNPDLQSRALVVESLAMIPVEFIARNHLTGSAWESYKKTGAAFGQPLPAGLVEGDGLPCTIFTPTTKAHEGHDTPLNADDVRKEHPRETQLFLGAFAEITKLLDSRGIIVADGKAELGHGNFGSIVIGDEIGTPDACRFWDKTAWLQTRTERKGRVPPSFDKQLVRDWGRSRGINELDPTLFADCKRAWRENIPDDLIARVSRTYTHIFERITGMTLEAYQRDVLGIVW